MTLEYLGFLKHHPKYPKIQRPGKLLGSGHCQCLGHVWFSNLCWAQVPRLRNFNDKSTRHNSASMTSTPRHKDFPLAAAGILVVDGHIRLDPTEGVLPCADRSDRFDKWHQLAKVGNLSARADTATRIMLSNHWNHWNMLWASVESRA
jgi:hypothetical protein